MKRDTIHIEKWILVGISLLLLVWVISWIDKYANYYCESFDQMIDLGQPNTNHNVDLPINANTKCKNKCSSISRCYITGEQCMSDVDCYGCQPIIPNPQLTKNGNGVSTIRGENDAGKMSFSSPTYSELTTDIGSKAALYNKLLTKPMQYNEGKNTWRQQFNAGTELYNKKYKLKHMGPPGSGAALLQYPIRDTLSGQFKDDGPLPANSYLG